MFIAFVPLKAGKSTFSQCVVGLSVPNFPNPLPFSSYPARKPTRALPVNIPFTLYVSPSLRNIGTAYWLVGMAYNTTVLGVADGQFLATVTTACAKRTGVAASVEHMRREPARVILP